eukprot:m.51608 g.51608  ORF g.51608 m.51608 type:complete len:60 (+) comp10953_c0_seq1:277-456(+)
MTSKQRLLWLTQNQHNPVTQLQTLIHKQLTTTIAAVTMSRPTTQSTSRSETVSVLQFVV